MASQPKVDVTLQCTYIFDVARCKTLCMIHFFFLFKQYLLFTFTGIRATSSSRGLT